jgi:hypothetical protein
MKNYERLTRRIGNIIEFVDGKGYANLSLVEGQRLLFERLAEYEDKEYEAEFDSICYGCKYFVGEDEDCTTPKPCIGGNMNGYRMDG